MMKDQHALQFGAGGELGYQVVNDLWLSAGYNMQGFDGGDLSGTDYTAQGFYVRARYKFDEGLFR
jgi:murein tripeptide amidase MpaA